MEHKIEYSPEAEQHLRDLTARDQRVVLDGVDSHLVREPLLETRNRKPMRPNPIAPWVLRLGDLRVNYVVRDEPTVTVLIRAIGRKERNRVRIGKEYVDL